MSAIENSNNPQMNLKLNLSHYKINPKKVHTFGLPIIPPSMSIGRNLPWSKKNSPYTKY